MYIPHTRPLTGTHHEIFYLFILLRFLRAFHAHSQLSQACVRRMLNVRQRCEQCCMEPGTTICLLSCSSEKPVFARSFLNNEGNRNYTSMYFHVVRR